MLDVFTEAANVIRESNAIAITTGAGMGVDSGLPDFRGHTGFWRAYPPFKKLGLSFYDLADPRWFHDDPRRAWGFYGHRFHLYRTTEPHQGFQLLRQWSSSKQKGHFVFTSNVDGHFQAAGFANDKIIECHGSFSNLQCARPCSQRIWPATELRVEVDEDTMLAREPLPMCPDCGGIARPNILMFGDGQWIGQNTEDQFDRHSRWLNSIPSAELTIIEIGAGTAVPTVRYQSERIAQAKQGRLISINVRESEGPAGTISIAESGLTALREINQRLN